MPFIENYIFCAIRDPESAYYIFKIIVVATDEEAFNKKIQPHVVWHLVVWNIDACYLDALLSNQWPDNAYPSNAKAYSVIRFNMADMGNIAFSLGIPLLKSFCLANTNYENTPFC